MHITNTYVAFLRGINVTNHKMIRMEELRKAFRLLGFTNVRTLLNSGNVVFETIKTDSSTLAQTIEKLLEETFGYEITVIIRTGKEIQFLIDENPFKDIIITPETRLLVTFLTNPSKENHIFPHEPFKNNCKIVLQTENEICTVLVLSSNGGTPELMKILEKVFGKKVTTRNWNTIIKIGKILGEN